VLARPVREGYVGGDRRLRVGYEYDPEGRKVIGRAWFGPRASGAPGLAHGGSMLAILDEVMGLAAWMSGHYVMSVRLTAEFLRVLPLGTEARVEARVVRVRGRKVHTLGTLSGADGAAFSRAKGLYVVLPSDMIEQFRRAVSK